MLTLANVNTTQATTYYKRENYYSTSEALVNSEWRGQGASQYQLHGPIQDLDAYENIVNGQSPDGQTQLRQKQNHKEKKERAGIDLTFSAPKSVSLACLVGGDSRLEAAHREAVRKTIDLVESRYAFTRVNRKRVKTGNLIVAMWHHDTSRELDPHLHTHCLLMNCTQSPDGKWRTLSNEEFFRNKILLGQIYRNELALECRKLGYEIEKHPKELFEIKGYSREQIEGFSKRHEQIKEKLAQLGVEETTENKIWAWRKTRVKKNHEIDRKEMLPYWHEEADLYGIAHPIPSQQPELATGEDVEAELTAAVTAGIEHCSERKVAFKSEEIEKFVTAETRPFGINELQQAIASHPELIRTFDDRFTTQSAWNRELATIKLMHQAKGQVNPIAQLEVVESYLSGKTLTPGQRQAISLTATTNDSFIAWQGVAGAGKTYALKELRQITQEILGLGQGYTIKGFAPSAEAAKVLASELGIEAHTVARLLVSKQPDDIQRNQIWIVDEAGLLSAKAAHSLLERASKEQARVILVGDTRQLSAVEAGNPFKSLQQAGIATAHLNESLRQKPPDLQQAVNLAAAGQITEALSHLEQVNRIEELPDVSERTARIATEYIKISPQDRHHTLVLAGTHKERSAIVNQIRTALKQEGTLGYSVEGTQLRAKDLTSVQARYSHHYNVGDVVVPIREYRRTGLHKSQPYTVEAIAPDKLTLSDLAGNHLTVDPMKFRKTVYKKEAIEVAVGERLKWTRNDPELGRRNGQEFIVTAIDGNIAQITYQDSNVHFIDLSQPLHIDYALVSTTYSSQGKTADRVLISSTVDPTVSQESVYVAISRAKHDLKIFAENREFLFEQAPQSNAQETILELLQPQARVQVTPTPETTTKVSQAANTAPSATNKPYSNRQASSPNQSSEAKSAPPIKHIHENPQPVKPFNQPAPPLVIKHPAQKQPPLVAISQPANRKLPDWLAIGKRVHCQGQGWGEVQAVSGIKLVLKLDNGDTHHLLGWADAIKAKLVTPEPTEAFWIPDSTSVPPLDIEPEHWRELVEGSAIHPLIAARNFRSLQQDPVEQEHEAWGHLMYSDKLERINTGRLSTGMLNRYAHIDAGGWWCSAGVDSRSFKDLQPGHKSIEKIWGCYKPNAPRENLDKPGKKIKYEHPPKTDLSIFLLDVPHEMQQQIYQKAEVNPSPSDLSSGFWYCVWKHNVPITITEGAKKAASLLSQGHAAIGLPGIYAGYRSKDEQGQEIKARLMDELAVFGTKEREIKFCFDYETRPDTKRNIDIAISRTGSLLERQGAYVSVVSLPGPEKGVDDLLVTQGPLAYEKLDREAPRLSAWRARNKAQHSLLPQPADKLGLESRKQQLKAKLAPRHQTSTPLPSSSLSSVEPPAHELDITQLQENSDERPDFHQSQLFNRADIVRSISTRFSPSQPSIGTARNQPHQFATGVGELSQAISGAVEQQQIQRIVGAVEKFSRSLRNCQPPDGVTEKLRAAIAQLYAAITAELGQTTNQSLIAAQPEILRSEVTQEEDSSSKEIDAATPSVTLEQQRLLSRQLYEELQKQVRQYPGFSDSSNWDVDVGVALLVMKESSDHNEVGRVLAQSDQLKEWKATLPEDEYMTKGKAYIHQVYEQAQHLREVRALQQQQKPDSDLEL